MLQPDARELATGKWADILGALRVAEPKSLSGRHAPCPMCGGKDRFRFDNKEGRGTWICSHCGAGDGFDLAMMVLGEDFATVANRIREVAGECRERTTKPALSEAERKAMLRDLWKATKPTKPGDVVDTYLRSRGVGLDRYPESIRTLATRNPAMVAVVSDPDGNPATLHKTLLKPDGSGKADVKVPRLLMPGAVPQGAAVRLGGYANTLGIAEGIETALAAAKIFDIPVWAAINTSIMKQWRPPEGVDRVWICGDCDTGFAGQAAAYQLAYALSGKCRVTVNLPHQPGEDFNDILRRREAA